MATETKTRSEQGTREETKRRVILKGLRPIMFDRYPGDNDTKLEPWQRLNLAGPEGRTICLPSASIMSFLSAQNTDSAPKRILDSRKYKDFCFACAAFISVDPVEMVPFKRDGKDIEFGVLGKGEVDAKSGVYVDRRTARLEKGIPNPKVRPVLPLPWFLEFTLTLYPNQKLQEQQLINVFTLGGVCVGFGTFRPQYGKFCVELWE
jgi:hypothetical protein